MRIAVLSDVHANLPALDAVLADAGPVDAVWHLGDIVGYGPDPNGVIARLREVGSVGVRGNHDAAAAGGSEIDWFNPDARRAMEWTRTVLDPSSLAWLRDLPERREARGCGLVHGSPRQPLWEYILSTSEARDNLDVLEQPIGLHGHTHIPVVYVEEADGAVRRVAPELRTTFELGGRRALVNPGSVGQPRDGDRRSSYLVLDPDAGTATWHRVAYDIEAVQAAMRAAGLPAFLISRLSTGT